MGGGRASRAAAAEGVTAAELRAALPIELPYMLRTATLENLEVIVLDKDGTLLDFNTTWLPALREVAAFVAETAGDPALVVSLLATGGYMESGASGGGPCVLPGSIMLEGTNDELAGAWIEQHPAVAKRWGSDPAGLAAAMKEVLHLASVRDAAPLTAGSKAGLEALRAAGVKLAVVTNDEESLAIGQLERLGWLTLFDKVSLLEEWPSNASP